MDTHSHTYLFVQRHLCKRARRYSHQSNPHACTQRRKHTRSHTDASTHPGVPWRLVRCAVLQDWIISQLWVGQPRICPNPRHSVHIASHAHTHSPVPAPTQQRALLSLFCLFAPAFLHFLSFLLSMSPSGLISPRVVITHPKGHSENCPA